MKTGSTNIRQLQTSTLRIDPITILSEGHHARQAIIAYPFGTLTVKDCSMNIFYGNIFSRIFVTKPSRGMTYLAASDTVLSDLNTGKYLSLKQAQELSYLILKKDWIVITCSGTIGNVTYTNGCFEGKIATHDLIRVIPNNNGLLKGILYALLASKYGYFQLTQSQFGGVVKHINEKHVSSILVPKFPIEFQTEVDGLIQDSARLREEAAESLERAVSYFDNLYPVTIDKTKIFSKRINSMTLNGCFAAYNNNIENINFINQYIHDSFKVKDVTTKVFAPPLFKHIYLQKDNGYPFMTGSELTQYNLRYYRWLSPKGMKDINDYVVHEGDLLLYKSGTTDGGILGNVFIADQKLDGCCLSDHVIRMFFKNRKIAYWTFAFLRSKGAKEMLKALATGAMIPFITPERLKEINIPKPNEKEDWIYNLIEAYINKNSLSKKLEDKAIRMVEEEIEKWNK